MGRLGHRPDVQSRGPADGRDLVGRFQAGGAADAARAIRAAGVAASAWRATPAPKRGEILHRFGALMAEHKERRARAMTREVGKVLDPLLQRLEAGARGLRLRDGLVETTEVGR